MKRNVVIGFIVLVSMLMVWWVADWLQYRQTLHMGLFMRTMHNTMSMAWGMWHHRVSSELDFLVNMIPHHQEAVDTASRLAGITQNPALQELTQAIVVGQADEISMMQWWLDTRYPDASYESTYMPMMRDTAAMSAIATIERMWLEDMIKHHMGAVMMAQQVLRYNPRPEVANFSRAVIEVQSEEIDLMQQLLQNY